MFSQAYSAPEWFEKDSLYEEMGSLRGRFWLYTPVIWPLETGV